MLQRRSRNTNLHSTPNLPLEHQCQEVLMEQQLRHHSDFAHLTASDQEHELHKIKYTFGSS